jgi:3-hydroxy acid dehydrogenase/malonic semialdehyde reductase
MTLFTRTRHTLLTTNKTLIRHSLSHPSLPHHHHFLRMTSSMSARLKGKTILITGASSGIGRSCAFEFANTSPDDLKLILTARRIDTLKEIAQEIEKQTNGGVKVHSVKLDVSVPEEVSALVGNLPQEFREVDVLVNNA